MAFCLIIDPVLIIPESQPVYLWSKPCMYCCQQNKTEYRIYNARVRDVLQELELGLMFGNLYLYNLVNKMGQGLFCGPDVAGLLDRVEIRFTI